jgi:deoxyribonuclease-4
MKKNRILLGAHMSVEGGLYRALERGHSIQCNTIQIFSRNANRWAAKDLSSEEISAFRSYRRKTGIAPVFSHCSYLINLGSAGQFYDKSVASLIQEVRRAEQLGLNFVVLHPGAHMGCGEEEGLQCVVDALGRVADETRGYRCKIAIENTAGQGSCLGSKIEHLEWILKHASQPDRIGFCIDTCHIFAAGYDIRTAASYSETMDRLLDAIPSRKILAFHLNDSKKALASHVDRHEHIGKGFIGAGAFDRLMNDSRFIRIPKILETPKGKDLAEDVINLSLLRSFLKQAPEGEFQASRGSRSKNRRIRERSFS